MSLSQRLQGLLNDYKLTPYKLSKATKVSQPTIARLLKNEGTPTFPTISQLATYLKVNPEWLMHGEGEKEDTEMNVIVNDAFQLEYFENGNSNSFVNLENGQYLMTMPLADYDIQAGFLDVYQDIEQLKELGKHSIIVDKPVKGRYIAFRVKGDSMDSGRTHAITERSIVTTRELGRQNWSSKLRFKDFPLWVIYTTQSKMPLLKQIIDHDVEKATIKCHSLNESPEYVDFDLSLNDVQALFYVIDVSRSVSRYEEY